MAGQKAKSKKNASSAASGGRFSRMFGEVANKTSQAAGRASAFMIAASVVLVWAITGPLFQYSDTWQLVINTGTTIVTFLMVFLIQNSQNRDSAAVQIKLDELIHALSEARDELVDIEDGTDEDMRRLRKEFEDIGQHKHHAPAGKAATT